VKSACPNLQHISTSLSQQLGESTFGSVVVVGLRVVALTKIFPPEISQEKKEREREREREKKKRKKERERSKIVLEKHKIQGMRAHSRQIESIQARPVLVDTLNSLRKIRLCGCGYGYGCGFSYESILKG
jgi:hypothetical protein